MKRRDFIKSAGLFVPMIFAPQIIEPVWKKIKPIKIKGVFEAVEGDKYKYSLNKFNVFNHTVSFVNFNEKNDSFKIGDEIHIASFGGILPVAGGKLVKKEYIYA